MEQVDYKFARLLGDRRLEEMNAYPDSVFGIWKDYRIAYLNPAWFRFAAENRGEPNISERWGLGVSMVGCIPDVLKKFFDFHFEKCLRLQAPWSHDYECSSDTVYRKFHQNVYPAGDAQGFVVVNTLVLQAPFDEIKRPAHEADEAQYVDNRGRTHQCSNCRRVMHQYDNGSYHWVPEWVKHPRLQLLHTLCLSCCYGYLPLE